MWYKYIAGRFFGLVTKHACDRQTYRRMDRQNYDSQDRASGSSSSSNIQQHTAQIQLFHSHYTGQPVLDGTSSQELEDFVGAKFFCTVHTCLC